MSEELNGVIKELTSTTAMGKNNAKQIDEIKDRLDKHEEKFERIQETNITLAKMSTILEQMQDDKKRQEVKDEKIVATLDAIQDTLSITANNMTNLERNQHSMDDKLSILGSKVEEIDNKSKIDFLRYIQQNFWKIVFSATGTGFVFKILYEIIQKLPK